MLIIEDDQRLNEQIRSALTDYGFSADGETTGDRGLAAALTNAYDVIVLDRMIPIIDGLSVLREVRKASVVAPVLILSAVSAVHDRVEGLSEGGDDYLAKPFEFIELTARVDALTRRSKFPDGGRKIVVGDLELDRVDHILYVRGSKVELLPKEASIVEYLMSNADKLVTRKMIFEAVWGYDFNHQSTVIDVHIGKIRKKLDPSGLSTRINTVRNSGFILYATL